MKEEEEEQQNSVFVALVYWLCKVGDKWLALCFGHSLNVYQVASLAIVSSGFLWSPCRHHHDFSNLLSLVDKKAKESSHSLCSQK
jgi:hypothetical protein